MTTSAAPRLKAALYGVCNTLWNTGTDTVYVTYGMPAFDSFDDVVSMAATTSASEPAAVSSARRPRWETLTQDVIFYCFASGGQEQEVVVMQRAYALLAQLEEYVRITDTTLGGVVQECWLTDHASDAATDQEVLSKGRLHVLTATFTARYRITS